MSYYLKLLFLFGLMASLGCQTADNKNVQWQLKPYWIRGTVKDHYLKGQRMQRMTPLFYKDLVVQGNGVDGLSVYEQKNGRLLWKLAVPGGVEGGAAIDQSNLYFGGNDGMFYSVNVDSGRISWTFPAKAQVLAAPLVHEDSVYFISGNNTVYSLNTKNGQKNWSYHRQQGSHFSVRGGSRPTILGNSLYIGTSDGYLVSLKSKDGALVWEKKINTNKRFKDVDASPLIDGDRIYISSFDGSLFCLGLKNGRTIWRYDEGGYFPPTVKGNQLYYATSTGKIVALYKETGKVIWSQDVKKGIATQPVLKGNHLLIGESEGSLRVLRQKTGESVVHYDPGHGILAPPAISPYDKNPYFISNEGNLFAMRFTHD